MRSIWKGRMGFGLVGMDVKLHKATDESDTPMHLMHTDCGGGRISYLYKCMKCEAVLGSRSELKKGYEYSKDQYVILNESDFESLPLKTMRQIEIVGFVEGSVDPRATEATYYLSPDKGSANEKPFQLILKAMERLNVEAIGKLAYREREHICVIQPFEGIMLLQTLYYANEIRDCGELKLTAVALSEKEMELGEALVKQMVMPFDHSVFKDEYREALEALIEAKVEGREIVRPKEAEIVTGDLVDQLLASINIGARV